MALMSGLSPSCNLDEWYHSGLGLVKASEDYGKQRARARLVGFITPRMALTAAGNTANRQPNSDSFIKAWFRFDELPLLNNSLTINAQSHLSHTLNSIGSLI